MLKGVDTGRTCVKISLYPQENMHYFLFGKGVISEFSYSLDNREDTNLTLSAYGAMVAYSVWN